LFYDGPEPPEGLYNELLQLPTSSRTIFNGSFTDFVLGRFLPTYERWARIRHLQFLLLLTPPYGSGYFDGVPMMRFTEPVIKAYANESKVRG
jgi:hypothetical protein